MKNQPIKTIVLRAHNYREAPVETCKECSFFDNDKLCLKHHAYVKPYGICDAFELKAK